MEKYVLGATIRVPPQMAIESSPSKYVLAERPVEIPEQRKCVIPEIVVPGLTMKT